MRMEELQVCSKDEDTDRGYGVIRGEGYVIGYREISGEHSSHKREHEAALELLFHVLSGEFGIDAEKLTLAAEENGKPYFKEGGIFFNISHCRSMAVCAVSGVHEVGVDVESVKPCRENTAKRVMSEAEFEYFLSAEDRDRAFFRIWTYKESVVKLTGEGIRRDLREIDSLKGDLYKVKQFVFTLKGNDYIISCAIN